MISNTINISQSTTSVAISSTANVDYMQTQSTMSPISPSISTKFTYTATDIECKYCVEYKMITHGYIPLKELERTLQGSVWKVQNKNNETCIIKITQKSLHKQSITLVKGKKVNIKEDILKETAILKYLTANNPPKSFVKYIDFFADDYNYFLVMEYGGTNLFDFVQKGHKFIRTGKLTVNEWQKFCKIAMKQIVDVVEWMHNKMNCAHLDISLENFVISDVMIEINSSNHMIFLPNFQIKIIDFGVAEVFTKLDHNGQIDFKCTKYVGKTRYKSPRVYGKKKIFDARLADCWSIGVLLYSMVFGVIPFQVPDKTDILFQQIISGNLLHLLIEIDRLSYVTAPIFSLISRIFKYEKNRLNIDGIKNHQWLNN